MHTKIVRRCGALLCALGVCFWLAACLLFPAAAADPLCSLTLICKSENVTLSGMQWNLYRVGTRAANDQYQLQGDFANYAVSLADMSASAMQDAADTLENYAVIDKIKPLQSEKTDENGSICFSELEKGLYLLAGKTIVVGDARYVPSAVLVELTGEEEDLDLLTYPKFKVRNLPSSDTEQYIVRKIWANDAEHQEDRTASITVELYQDGTLADAIQLNEANNWTYYWSADSLSEWRVKEAEVPENYTIIYRGNETQFVIINTYASVQAATSVPVTSTVAETTTTVTTVTQAITSEETTPVSTTTVSSETLTTTSAEITVTTVKTTNAGGGVVVTQQNSSSGSGKLPQTGQLWWPVPVLAGVGLVMIVVGWRLHAKNK